MFGYVRPSPERLNDAAKARFQQCYCGLCHALGRKYGFAARFILNYDFTFLAILLSGTEKGACTSCRCAAHPFHKQCVMAESRALETAADHSVVLTWWQIRDHIEDHGFFKGLLYRLAALFLRGAYRKAKRAVPQFDRAVQEKLTELSARERENCPSLDAAAEPFAALMAEIAQCVEEETLRRVMAEIFYHLGRWIYLVDAADDLKKDFQTGNYNPLRYRYDLKSDTLSEEEKKAVALSLDLSVRRMADAYALLERGAWSDILDSIFYESLYMIGTSVLNGTYHKPPRREHFRTKPEEKEDTV